MVESLFELDNISLYKRICGFNDKNLHKIEEKLGVTIIPRGTTLIVKAPEEKSERAMRLLHLLSDVLRVKGEGYEFDDFDINYLASTVLSGEEIKPEEISRLKLTFQETGKVIVPKTINQAHYITSLNTKPITISTGPAGTGKTFLAVAVALKFFLMGKVERIVLTRPAVEAGENLGYLPGDLLQKINPYLRPLYDALFELQPYEKISKLIETDRIEIAPLAYMRGRTLKNSFIILDEAQNTSISQMKMFLTRMGNNSKIVLSGDDTQVDLEKPKSSGLLHAKRILKGIKDISVITFTREDISRHPLVEKIVAAYEKNGYSE